MIKGMVYSNIQRFNPVLGRDGCWYVSKDEYEYIEGNDVINPNFENYYNADDLSDVFNAENIDSDDILNILQTLEFSNKLQRKDIRFTGLTFLVNTLDIRTRMINDGFTFIEN